MKHSSTKPALVKKVEKSNCLACNSEISLYSSHCQVCLPIHDAIFARNALEAKLDEKLFYSQFKVVVTYSAEDTSVQDEQGNNKTFEIVKNLPLLKIFKNIDLDDDGNVTDGHGRILGEHYPWNDKLNYYKLSRDFKTTFSIVGAKVKKRARFIQLDD
jgi:hypothetical protein